uniref:Uncharacterized protein n=1 Tax=Anguilla anguilla TaxID=7936 RepID=A0A0E9X773_ANGAN
MCCPKWSFCICIDPKGYRALHEKKFEHPANEKLKDINRNCPDLVRFETSIVQNPYSALYHGELCYLF